MATIPQATTPPTSSAIAAELLRNLVITGELRAGQPMREQELATRFNMSRTPIREAIAQLVSDGLLVKDARGATTVFAPAADELLELYVIRLQLEPFTVRLGTERNGEEHASMVSKRLEVLERSNGTPAWAAAHEEFHLALIESCPLDRLRSLVTNLRLQSEPYARLLVNADMGFAAAAAEDHRHLAAMVVAGAATDAESATAAHLNRTVGRLHALIGMGALS